MITLGAVKEREYELMEQGEYVLTLSELDESMGAYGERLVWKWYVSTKDDPDTYLSKKDGTVRSLWAFSDPDCILGSLTHEFAQALTGRTLGRGDEPPSEYDLLNGRCIAYVTHYTPKTGKNAGKKQEKIVEGSVKPFRQTPVRAARSEPAAAPDEDDDGMSRDDLIAAIKKQIRRAALLDVPQAAEWKEIDLGAMGTKDLRAGLAEIEAACKVAAEA